MQTFKRWSKYDIMYAPYSWRIACKNDEELFKSIKLQNWCNLSLKRLSANLDDIALGVHNIEKRQYIHNSSLDIVINVISIDNARLDT